MNEYRVRIPEYATAGAGLRKMTVHEFLREFAVAEGGRVGMLTLPAPVHLVATMHDGHGARTRQRFTSAGSLFRFFDALGRNGGLIVSLSWQASAHQSAGKLGAHGLFLLNRAIRTPAHKRGGKNFVRHFISAQRGGAPIATRDTLFDLFAWLEIRPVFTRKKGSTRGPHPTHSSPSGAPKGPDAPEIMSNKGLDIKGRNRGRKGPHARRKRRS